MSLLGAFTNQMVQFFEDLGETIPEEKSIRGAAEAIRGAKKINPGLILDLFYEHIYKELHVAIDLKNVDMINAYGRVKIQTQFNEIMPAIMIFDRHWPTLSSNSQEAIWKYLKVLCVLCERLKGISPTAGK